MTWWNDDTHEMVETFTQSIISLIIVIGGGLMIASNNANSDMVIGIVAAVVGFYFRLPGATKEIRNGVKSMTALAHQTGETIL